MFPRIITETLCAWMKRSDRKPLLVRGARQVGKTTAIRMFAESMPGFMELNLEAPGEKTVFERDLAPRELIGAIRLMKGVTAPLEESLLFLDEVQASPFAVRSLRHLHEGVPELPVIASGSLLETLLPGSGIEFPVGRVEHCFMHPAVFREYLGAQRRTDMADLLDVVPLPDYAFPAIHAEHVRFALTGGMPEIVNSMASGAGIESLGRIYSSLLVSFMDDVPKYASNRSMAEVLRHCIASVPLDAGTRIHFAGFGGSHYRSREVGEAMRTLEQAMLIHLAYPTSEVSPPPRTNHRRAPKLFFLDSGLLAHALGAQAELLGTADLNDHFKGVLAEQCVGQALLSLGVDTLPSVRFWARESRGSAAEVDFIVQHSGKLIPIEVKSGSTGRLRSLHLFMQECDHDMAVRFYGGPVRIDPVRTPSGKEYRLLSLPHFLAGELPRYLEWFASEGGEA